MAGINGTEVDEADVESQKPKSLPFISVYEPEALLGVPGCLKAEISSMHLRCILAAFLIVAFLLPSNRTGGVTGGARLFQGGIENASFGDTS